MEKNLKVFIKDVCRKQSDSLVGKACSHVESIEKELICSEETTIALNLRKTLLKELIHQEFRSLRNSIIFYLEGREYKEFKIYNPSKES